MNKMNRGMFLLVVGLMIITCFSLISATELILQPNSTIGKDSYIVSGSPNSNFGTDANIDLAPDTRRILLEFNLSFLSSSTPIINATLELYVTNQGSASIDPVVNLYRINKEWTESGVTWNKYDGVTNWNSAGGDYDSTIWATTTLLTQNSWYKFDITNLVKNFVNGSLVNYGVILRTTTSSAGTWNLASSDNTNSSIHPILRINYVSDIIPPNLTIISPTSRNYTTTSILINLSAQDENLQTIWFYNGSGNTTYTSGITQTLEQGWNTLIAYANDSLGNINTSSVSFFVDSTAPNLVIATPQDGTTLGYNTSIELNYSVTDSGVGMTNGKCWYNLDNGNNITLSNCANATFDASEGNHILNLFANDSLGNVNFKSASFNIQIGAPTILLHFPIDVYLNYNSNIYFNYTPSDVDLQACELWGNFDGEWKLNQTSLNPINGGVNYFILNLSDGNYLWNIRCNDSLGNSVFNGNKTFTIDTILPSLTLTQPTGSKTSRTISASWIVNDVNLNSCWYNVFRGASLEIGNTSIDCSSNATIFSVTVDADFTFNFYANDSAGNTNSASSSFSVSTSGGGSSGESRGGGGGSSTTIITQNETRIFSLDLGSISSMIVKPGERKKLSVSVKNTGNSFLNECKLVGKGANSGWIKSLENKGLAAGQEDSFLFELNTPEKLDSGSYNIEVEILCNEKSALTSFTAEIIEKKLDLKILKVERTGNNQVKVIYSLEELSGIEQDADLQFILMDSAKEKIAETEEEKTIPANSKQVFEVLLNIPAGLKGNFNLLVNFNSATYSSFVQEDVVLSAQISGLAIVEGGEYSTNAIVVLIVVLFVIFAYFMTKRIWKLRREFLGKNSHHYRRKTSTIHHKKHSKDEFVSKF